jgi:hypothetical protein
MVVSGLEAVAASSSTQRLVVFRRIPGTHREVFCRISE